MKDAYDPDWDSPEARANFATRHIFNIHERKRRRDELLEKLLAEKVVPMFPGHLVKNLAANGRQLKAGECASVDDATQKTESVTVEVSPGPG